MQQPPVAQSQIDERISGHEEELLRLWQAEQGGAAKDRDLQVVVSCIPFPRDRALRAADLGCGPGDLGRAIWRNYPDAQVDFVDRDPLLLSICRGFNGLAGAPGTCRQLDLDDESWWQGLQARHYDVMAAANALHWLSPPRAAAVLGDIHRLLDDGGISAIPWKCGHFPLADSCNLVPLLSIERQFIFDSWRPLVRRARARRTRRAGSGQARACRCFLPEGPQWSPGSRPAPRGPPPAGGAQQP